MFYFYLALGIHWSRIHDESARAIIKGVLNVYCIMLFLLVVMSGTLTSCSGVLSIHVYFLIGTQMLDLILAFMISIILCVNRDSSLANRSSASTRTPIFLASAITVLTDLLSTYSILELKLDECQRFDRWYYISSVCFVISHGFFIYTTFIILLKSDVPSSTTPPPRLTVATTTSDDNCAICLSSLRDTSDARTAKPECGHEFHEDCLRTWLQTRRLCPVCRYAV